MNPIKPEWAPTDQIKFVLTWREPGENFPRFWLVVSSLEAARATAEQRLWLNRNLGGGEIWEARVYQPVGGWLNDERFEREKLVEIFGEAQEATAAAELGRKGGSIGGKSKSRAKADASRENGKKGGRPPKGERKQ